MKKKHLIISGILISVALFSISISIAAKFRLPSKPTKKDSNSTPVDASVLQVGHLTRYYRLHVPPAINAKKTMPLLIVFHGRDSSGKFMERHTQFNKLADQKGFIVVYPDGISVKWDSLRRRPERTNDIGFVSALIDNLGQRYNLNRQRIYVTGFSNGAVFSQRIACELSNKIAASAAIASTMADELLQICKPNQPIPMLLINGTNDPGVPYESLKAGWLSVQDTAKFWRNHNRCSSQPVKSLMPENSQVRIETYQQCAHKTSVKLYVIQGGKHAWTIPQGDTQHSSTDPNRSLLLSSVVWDFVSQFSKK
jgi:polyhydroxybutyrate depolymerase